MRPLAEMLEALERATESDAARRGDAERSRDAAAAVGRSLPLVHRTGPPKQARSWRTILDQRTFRTDAPGTDRERDLGIPRAAYFFVGCGAYPEGIVGFVLDAASVLARPSTFTPFDSGALDRYLVPVEPARRAAWDDAERARVLADFLGAGGDAPMFMGPYLAAHFRDPLDYVRRGQRSEPDYPAYHGLMDESSDRRAWTVELQVHEDVPFNAGGALLDLVVGRPALLSDLPDDLLALARVAPVENEVLEAIADGIAARAVQASEGT